MAGKPQDRPMIHEERAQQTESGEPMYDPKRSLYRNGGSVAISIPSEAVNMLGFRAGEKRTVEIYDTGIWIPRGEPDE